MKKKSGNMYVVFALCWIAYALAYFCRVNLTVAIPNLMENYNWSKTQIGTIASGFFITYAIGQLVNGVIGDKFNPRYFVAIGLSVAGICNVLLMFVTSYFWFIVLWSLNGFFQSMLWGPILRTASAYTKKENSTNIATILSSSMIFGSIAAFSAAGFLINISWKLVFGLPGLIMFTSAIIWFLVIRFDSKTSANDKIEGVKVKKQESFLRFVFSGGLIFLGLSSVLYGFIKDSMSTWGPMLLSNSFVIDYQVALGYFSIIPIINFIGVIIAGWISKVTKGNVKISLSLLFGICATASVLMFLLLKNNIFVTIVLMSLISASMAAVSTILLGILPMTYTKEGRVSSVAGFLDFASYMGSALSGFIVGKIALGENWGNVVIIWIIAAIFGVVFVLMKNMGNKKAREI